MLSSIPVYPSTSSIYKYIMIAFFSSLMIKGKRNVCITKKTSSIGLIINTEAKQPQCTKNKMRSESGSQCVTGSSSFHLLVPWLSCQLCCSEVSLHSAIFSQHCPQQLLPWVISNKSFFSVVLGRAYHIRLSEWLCGLIWAVWGRRGKPDLSWLGSLCPRQCRLNTVCPVSPVVSIVDWMGPVFALGPMIDQDVKMQAFMYTWSTKYWRGGSE